MDKRWMPLEEKELFTLPEHQSSPTDALWVTRAYDVGNPCPGMGQAQKCDNGIPTFSS